MNQSLLGLLLYIFLAAPPVAKFMELNMVIHMHMQMTGLVIAGFLMARFFQQRYQGFFEKWNHNGVPGIMLFVITTLFWMLPRSMDEALTSQFMELFKFISLPFLAGIALRDSWKKLAPIGRNCIIIGYTILFLALGWLYIWSPEQLCNNYLVIEQIALGWGFLTTAIAMVVYLAYNFFIDPSAYE